MNILKTLLRLNVVLLSFFFILNSTVAQDIHHSQYYNVPMGINPALTGVFDGDSRFVGNFRDQWYKVPITYRTAYGSFDTKFINRKKSADERKGYFGGGVILNFDHAGDSKMGTIQIALSGSYTHMLTANQYLTAGLQVSGNQRSFKTDQLRFGLQYDGKQFNGQLADQEDFSDKTAFYADFSAGLNWHYKKANSRTNLSLGAALFHINEPNKSFWDEEGIVLKSKWMFSGTGVFELANKFDLVVAAIGQYQNPYINNVITAAGRIHLDTRPTRQKALQLGLSYRFNDGFRTDDALIPALEYHTGPWIFGLSYDINTSAFKVATGNLGGPELSVIHVFRNPSIPPPCPSCPRYL